jgi:hypothetical protein
MTQEAHPLCISFQCRLQPGWSCRRGRPAFALRAVRQPPKRSKTAPVMKCTSLCACAFMLHLGLTQRWVAVRTSRYAETTRILAERVSNFNRKVDEEGETICKNLLSCLSATVRAAQHWKFARSLRAPRNMLQHTVPCPSLQLHALSPLTFRSTSVAFNQLGSRSLCDAMPSPSEP